MTFPVHVFYLSQDYTYDCETTDGLHFICRLRSAQHNEASGAPPEEVKLTKGEGHHGKPGHYKVQLHADLMAGIEDFLRKDV
jgi:hypothetical protein